MCPSNLAAQELVAQLSAPRPASQAIAEFYANLIALSAKGEAQFVAVMLVAALLMQPLGVFGLLDFFSLPFIVSFALLGLVLWKMGTEGSRYVRGGPRSSGAFSLGRIWRKLRAMDIWELLMVGALVDMLLHRQRPSVNLHHLHGRVW